MQPCGARRNSETCSPELVWRSRPFYAAPSRTPCRTESCRVERVCFLCFIQMAAVLFRRGLKYGRAIAKAIENHPTITKWTTLSVLMLGGYTAFHREDHKRTNKWIAQRLKAGSNPKESQPPLEYSVDRSDVVKSIQKLLFESDPDNGKIGVVLGPAGSGKTRAVIEACSVAPGPNYILYQEIYQTSEAGKQLAHAADIALSRSTYDYIYRFLGFDSLFYFPSDPVEAMTHVLNKVAKRSMEAFEKEGLKKLPCFVIDASELLAVHKPDILNTILRLAQYYVRAKKLRIVLVDSDGITLSKINESLKHPIVDIVEVEDLNDHDAEQYLIERAKMSSDLAKRLVGLIGGRLLHLSCAVDAYHKTKSNDIGEDLQLVYDKIREYVWIKVITPINTVIISNAPISELIIKYFSQCDLKPLLPSELNKHLYSKGISPAEARKTIDVLVNANLLRYNANGRLMLHSKLVEAEIKAKYCDH